LVQGISFVKQARVPRGCAGGVPLLFPSPSVQNCKPPGTPANQIPVAASLQALNLTDVPKCLYILHVQSCDHLCAKLHAVQWIFFPLFSQHFISVDVHVQGRMLCNGYCFLFSRHFICVAIHAQSRMLCNGYCFLTVFFSTLNCLSFPQNVSITVRQFTVQRWTASCCRATTTLRCLHCFPPSST
jgi:hypothetical protein